MGTGDEVFDNIKEYGVLLYSYCEFGIIIVMSFYTFTAEGFSKDPSNLLL